MLAYQHAAMMTAAGNMLAPADKRRPPPIEVVQLRAGRHRGARRSRGSTGTRSGPRCSPMVQAAMGMFMQKMAPPRRRSRLRLGWRHGRAAAQRPRLPREAYGARRGDRDRACGPGRVLEAVPLAGGAGRLDPASSRSAMTRGEPGDGPTVDLRCATAGAHRGARPELRRACPALPGARRAHRSSARSATWRRSIRRSVDTPWSWRPASRSCSTRRRPATPLVRGCGRTCSASARRGTAGAFLSTTASCSTGSRRSRRESAQSDGSGDRDRGAGGQRSDPHGRVARWAPQRTRCAGKRPNAKEDVAHALDLAAKAAPPSARRECSASRSRVRRSASWGSCPEQVQTATRRTRRRKEDTWRSRRERPRWSRAWSSPPFGWCVEPARSSVGVSPG